MSAYVPRLSRAPTEHQSQAAVIDWWNAQCGAWNLPPFALFAIPNAAKRSFQLAAWMKSEGLRPGVPDLCLAVPAGKFHGLYIEMKASTKPSPDQEKVLYFLGLMGYRVQVCYSTDEAIRTIKQYVGVFAAQPQVA